MQTMLTIFSFIFGLIIGSFLNAVIYRLHKHKGLMGYSFCPHCKHRLMPADLVPLASFFWLKGRCRYCHKKISWQYPAVEFATAVLFASVTYQVFLLPDFNFFQLLFILAFVSFLILIFTFDLRYYLIPDVAVLSGISLALIYRLSFSLSFYDGLAGAGLLAVFFGLLYFISQGRWIGFGDVKLGIFLGLFLGFKLSIVMLFVAYVSGALVGVLLLLLKRTTMKGILPFGTFLTAASVVALIWGSRVISWYLGLY